MLPTPGPWELLDTRPHGGRHIAIVAYHKEGDSIICRIGGEYKPPVKTPTDQDLVNAKLIRKAPELMQALLYCLPRVHRHLADQAELKRIQETLDQILGE